MSTKRVLTILIGQTSEQTILTDLEPYDRLTIDFVLRLNHPQSGFKKGR